MDKKPDLEIVILEFESKGEIALQTSFSYSGNIRLTIDGDYHADMNAEELRKLAAECIKAAEHLDKYWKGEQENILGKKLKEIFSEGEIF